LKLAVVGEMAPALKGNGKTSESQVNAGGFDMAMAAVMAVLKTDPNGSTQARYRGFGEAVFPEDITEVSAEHMLSFETDNLMQQQSMLLGRQAADTLTALGKQAQTVTAEDEEVSSQLSVQMHKNVFPLVPGQHAEEAKPAEKQAGAAVLQAAISAAKIPEKSDVQKAASKPDIFMNNNGAVSNNTVSSQTFSETTRKAGTVPENIRSAVEGAAQDNSINNKEQNSLFTETIREADAMPKNIRLAVQSAAQDNYINKEQNLLFSEIIIEADFIPEKQEKVLQGTPKNNPVVAEEDIARTAPSVFGSNGKETARGNLMAGTLILGANAQAASAKGITSTETGQGRGADEVERAGSKENVMLSGKIEAGGTASVGEIKKESSGFNNFSGDTFQPDLSQLSTLGTLSNSAKDPKGVTLPSLKDVLVQEIKFICDTRKGEPTQVQITLEPEKLGKLTIKLFYSNGELNAHFYAGNEHVRGVLESSMQQLRENLGQQDLVLNQAYVSVGDENSGGTGSQTDFNSRQMEYPSDKNSGPFYQQSKMEPDGYYRTGNDFTQVNYLI
jgi:flagellar hook-length control protein FliK